MLPAVPPGLEGVSVTGDKALHHKNRVFPSACVLLYADYFCQHSFVSQMCGDQHTRAKSVCENTLLLHHFRVRPSKNHHGSLTLLNDFLRWGVQGLQVHL